MNDPEDTTGNQMRWRETTAGFVGGAAIGAGVPNQGRSLGERLRREYEQEKVAKDADPVNHPPHYVRKGIEVDDVIEAWCLTYRLGSAVAYILRSEHKGNPLTDLRKAKWFLDREIQRRGG